MKRIVTGNSPEGQSIFLNISELPRIITTAEGNQMGYAWKTTEPVVVSYEGDDPTLSMSQALGDIIPSPGETNFLFATIPGKIDGPNFVMHATDTIDYIVIVSGEVWLILDEGAEVHLTAGDCVIQNGTLHTWDNRSSEPCILASTMVGAARKA